MLAMSFSRLRLVLSLLVPMVAGASFAAEPSLWKADTTRTNITPAQPLWMASYSSRDKAADGKVLDLWLKVLALEDALGHHAMIVYGLPAERWADDVDDLVTAGARRLVEQIKGQAR